VKRKQAFILVAGALLLIGAVVTGIFLLPQEERWVSRKGGPRSFGETGFFTRSETLLPSGLKTLSASAVKREPIDRKLSFIWEEPTANWKRAAQLGRIPPRHIDDENQVVTFPGGGRLRLAWATMGYDPDLGDFPAKEPFTRTKVTVRGDTWEPLSEEAFHRYQLEDLKRETLTKGFLPTWGVGAFSLKLDFLPEGLPDFRPVGSIELMNLDTMTPIGHDSGGSFNDSMPGMFHSMPAAQVFYPARIAAGFDVAYGPFEEARIPLRPGSRGRVTDLEVEIIAIERFAWSSASSGKRIRKSGKKETRSLEFDLDPKREPQTQIVFSMSAPELGRFCDLVLIHHDGKEETIELGNVYTVSYVSTQTPPEELEAVVLRYRSNQARVVFELPPLRGVPERNEEIENLFDITLPHFEARDAWDLERAVAFQAGVQFNLPDAVFPNDHFPRHYENVTLHALLDEYLAHHPEGMRVRLDPATLRLVVPERFGWKKKWMEFRKWMGI
jgi:hypothetical protein